MGSFFSLGSSFSILISSVFSVCLLIGSSIFFSGSLLIVSSIVFSFGSSGSCDSSGFLPLLIPVVILLTKFLYTLLLFFFFLPLFECSSSVVFSGSLLVVSSVSLVIVSTIVFSGSLLVVSSIGFSSLILISSTDSLIFGFLSSVSGFSIFSSGNFFESFFFFVLLNIISSFDSTLGFPSFVI